jgi:hypothetical protein
VEDARIDVTAREDDGSNETRRSSFGGATLASATLAHASSEAMPLSRSRSFFA